MLEPGTAARRALRCFALFTRCAWGRACFARGGWCIKSAAAAMGVTSAQSSTRVRCTSRARWIAVSRVSCRRRCQRVSRHRSTCMRRWWCIDCVSVRLTTPSRYAAPCLALRKAAVRVAVANKHSPHHFLWLQAYEAMLKSGLQSPEYLERLIRCSGASQLQRAAARAA